MIERRFGIPDALLTLCPGAQWSLLGDAWDGLTWLDVNVPMPDEAAVLAEIDRLQSEYDALQYQRLRQPEYPPLADLADALYWQSQGDESKMTAYLAAVQAVKDRYPKE